MVRVLFFGQIADIAGVREIHAEASDTQSLLATLVEKYPPLQNAVFALAVNRITVHTNTKLSALDEVALLPPYSGG